MGNIGIMNLTNYGESINPEAIFGKDTKRISDACQKIMRNWLHPYEGCYRASYPSFTELQEIIVIPKGSNFAVECKKFLAQWYVEHPEEEEKVKKSHEEWENQNDKQFRIVYGIARRHGLYLEWHGNSNPCCGDQWTIYRKHKRIARICC